MKKNFTLLLLLFCCSIAQANEVKCYAPNGRLLYSHHITDVSYIDDNILSFVEQSSGKVVITTLDCVVKIPE